MSKNTDFFKLGPYSRKESIRTGIGTKIGQTEGKRAKTVVSRALTRQQCADHASGRAPIAGRTRGSPCAVAGRPVRSSSARLCRRHVSLPRWSYVAPADSLSRRPPPLAGYPFFFSSLSSKIRNKIPFFDFHIFRSVDRIDMISSTKF